jgi:inhibitor of KinA sporulation pathway (predicted exonuclease)
MRDTSRILVVDVESTCWNTPREQGEQVSEIIEVGVAVYHTDSKTVSDKASYFVRPEVSTVGEFCSGLTGITMEMVANARTMAEVCAALRQEFGSHKVAWASYGNYDRKKFEEDCRLKRVDYPFTAQHLNVKALVLAKFGQSMGMDKALARLGLPLVGRHHRGDDDAWNIAHILKALVQ